MGRNVSDKTMNDRYTAVFGILAKADKVAEIVNNGLTDAKNRMNAFERRKTAKIDLMRSFNLSDEQINGMLAVEGLDGDTGADKGRVDSGAELLAALATLAKHHASLKHYLTGSAEGKELINDLF